MRTATGIHLVLFDIDGTLVDADEFDSELYVRAVREVLGIEITCDLMRTQRHERSNQRRRSIPGQESKPRSRLRMRLIPALCITAT